MPITKKNDDPQRPALAIAERAKPKVEAQQITLSGRKYQVVVGNPEGHWHCFVLRSESRIFGPRECGSEFEAKFIAHAFAFHDAGIHDHYCNGNCSPWVEAG